MTVADATITRPDLAHHLDPCERCGQPHVTWRGNPACKGHRRDGTACTKSPLAGTDVCATHGGNAPQVRRAAKRRNEVRKAADRMASEALQLGHELDGDPAGFMLAMVREAAGNVAVMRSLVQSLEPEALDLAEGIAGPLGDMKVHNAAAPHVWVAMYDAERERLVRWSKMCREAGVDERLVAVAEEQGQWLVSMLERVLAALGLSEEQWERVPTVVAQVIDTIAVESGG